MYDDNSDAEKVANLTNFLVHDDSKYAALLGPYSSTLTAVAAPIVDNSNKLLIANGAAVESIFVGKNTFSTSPRAGDYLRFVLQNIEPHQESSVRSESASFPSGTVFPFWRVAVCVQQLYSPKKAISFLMLLAIMILMLSSFLRLEP